MINRIFVQTSFWKGEAGYVFCNGLCSVIFLFIQLADKRNSKIYKVNSFIENVAALKYSMSTERHLDRTGVFYITLLITIFKQGKLVFSNNYNLQINLPDTVWICTVIMLNCVTNHLLFKLISSLKEQCLCTYNLL